jgi:hypothetical protein
MILNNDLEWMWKAAVTAYFKVIPIFSIFIEENRGTFCQYSWFKMGDMNPVLPEYEPGVFSIQH